MELKAETIVPQGSAITLQMYGKADVDAAIAELKAKLESVQATAYTESVDAGMENRKPKRRHGSASTPITRKAEFFGRRPLPNATIDLTCLKKEMPHEQRKALSTPPRTDSTAAVLYAGAYRGIRSTQA